MPNDNIPSQKYRDAGIPRYFVTRSALANLLKKKQEQQDRQRRWQDVHAAGCNTADSVSSNKAFSSGIIIQHDPLYLRDLIAVDNLFQQANKTCNSYIISFTKLGNQKGKCPACWHLLSQIK